MIYYTGDIHGSADALVRFCINKIKKSQDVEFRYVLNDIFGDG